MNNLSLEPFCEWGKGQKFWLRGRICLRTATLMKNIEWLQAQKDGAKGWVNMSVITADHWVSWLCSSSSTWLLCLFLSKSICIWFFLHLFLFGICLKARLSSFVAEIRIELHISSCLLYMLFNLSFLALSVKWFQNKSRLVWMGLF